MNGRDSVLVSADWLAANLGTAHLCVVDIRGAILPLGTKPTRYVAKRSDYDAAHVPGAVFVDWTRDIVDEADPVPAQLAKQDAFAEKMGEIGIGDDTLVVVYDDYKHIFAGRMAWALRYYGHDAVRILDGGWSRWIAEGRPTSREVAPRAIARFSARPRSALRMTADEVARALGQGDVLLVDARPSDQYAGEASAAGRSGHIPGAQSLPYARLVDEKTGTFLPNDDLAKVFADAGIDIKKLPPEIIVYCNGGVSCTVPLLALRMLGRDGVTVYDGSWNEWGNDNRRPIAQGRQP